MSLDDNVRKPLDLSIGRLTQEETQNKQKPQQQDEGLIRPIKINKSILLESGVHFGHKTRDWNPKAFKYLYGIHNDIHVINLSQTLKLWSEARQKIIDTIVDGMDVLFVGTKKQASHIIKREALNCGQHYVDVNWKGGTLTNLKTMRNRVKRLEYLDNLLNDAKKLSSYVKKEKLAFEKERNKLEQSIGGIRNMNCYPGLLFVVDVNKEKIAVSEAKELGIPVLGFLDSDCSPEDLDYKIPANDDAYKSVKLFICAAADAVLEGKQILAQKNQTGLEALVEDLTYNLKENENIDSVSVTGIDNNISITTGSDTP